LASFGQFMPRSILRSGFVFAVGIRASEVSRPSSRRLLTMFAVGLFLQFCK
jgi:hypothetical protein